MPAHPVAGQAPHILRESLRIAGAKESRDCVIEVRHPYTGAVIAGLTHRRVQAHEDARPIGARLCEIRRLTGAPVA
jgi:hypothetical protein